ncbi:MAG: hypothetical protein HQL50_03410 [Magnetococcales bacterium]|nr:hypothetical protein [Magnetococcales bacterium]
MDIVYKTDPISNKKGDPEIFVREGSCTILFESEENKRIYEKIPLTRGVSDLDNPSDDWFDEG